MNRQTEQKAVPEKKLPPKSAACLPSSSIELLSGSCILVFEVEVLFLNSMCISNQNMARSKDFDENDILQRLRDLVLAKEKIVSADCFGQEYLTVVYVDDVIDRSICTITVSYKCRIVLIFFLFYTPIT